MKNRLERGSVPITNDDEDTDFMPNFWEKVTIVKSNMSKIRNLFSEIEKVSNTTGQALDRAENDMDSLISRGNAMVSETKDILMGIHEENRVAAKKDSGSAELRIRQNQCSTLSRELKDLITEYEDVQTNAKERVKKTLARHLKIATKRDYSPEEIDEQLRAGTDVFAKSILERTGAHSTATVQHAMAKEKYVEILKIEESLVELHELFTDLAMLVETQDELIDTIQVSIRTTNENVKTGAEEIKKARAYQTASRKKIFCIICLVVVILLVLLVVVGGIAGGVGFALSA